jgi:hypothetical protein
VQALAKFAFGMGTLQMLICTVAFALLGLPPGTAYFSQARWALLSCVLISATDCHLPSASSLHAATARRVAVIMHSCSRQVGDVNTPPPTPTPPTPPPPPPSQFLEGVLQAPAALAELRTVDEALVIGAALSLSSSAFVLQLLRERGELDTRFGQATLGILLLQDIATVPFLVLLPLVEGNNAGAARSAPGLPVWRCRDGLAAGP